MTKYKILSTKKLSSEVLDKADNVTIDQLPFISTEPIKNEELKKKLKGYLQQNINAVFTSQNAVKAFEQIANASVPWKIFSLANATRDLVAKTFDEDKISGTAANAADLAGVISKDESIKKVVFFCGDQKREDLPSILKSKGIEVEEVIVYETSETPQKVSGKYDGILFFSPSAVNSFFSLNKINKETQLFAIGNTTADAIKLSVDKKIIIAEKPAEENMIDTMLAHFNKPKTG
jgi:uroporphyrinogen-III synthase